jgi:hypothetical protein
MSTHFSTIQNEINAIIETMNRSGVNKHNYRLLDHYQRLLRRMPITTAMEVKQI